jgi:hypothetical protein
MEGRIGERSKTVFREALNLLWCSQCILSLPACGWEGWPRGGIGGGPSLALIRIRRRGVLLIRGLTGSALEWSVAIRSGLLLCDRGSNCEPAGARQKGLTVPRGVLSSPW